MRKMAVVLGLLVVAGTLGWGQDRVPQPGADGIYFDYGGVKPPTLIHAEPAVIPAGSNLGGEKLLCALEVVVGADGFPKIIAVGGKVGPLDEAAVAAVRQSQFAPGTLYGKPVPVRIFVWVPFLGADKAAIPVTGQLNKVPGVIAPKVLNSVEAEFSDEARQRHISGTVLVAMAVTEDGMPADARVVMPVGAGLDEQALKAVRKYKFSPATFEGVPVAVPITVEVRFMFPFG